MSWPLVAWMVVISGLTGVQADPTHSPSVPDPKLTLGAVLMTATTTGSHHPFLAEVVAHD